MTIAKAVNELRWRWTRIAPNVHCPAITSTNVLVPPFRFRGKSMKLDRESGSGRFVKRKNGSPTIYMASLPLDANVQFMTLIATKMPFIGRG